ncbi:hypothetical protein SKAU_G00095340 [Synaphobranchus kaupii]|uniref:CCHC-type domain-containing protein n=1 Tax=Synaphobranchus kaupii TaxID=118154 RepID=A0A9Q1FXJ0_SYNKA|nr:hypothetical protein SKAU_G00095340 [Synaphobranchus kaupii]
MDPADSEQLRHAITCQGAMIGQHEQLLQDIMETLKSLFVEVGQMGSQVLLMSTSLPPPVPTAPPSPPASVQTATDCNCKRVRLSPEERLRRIQAGACLNCGQAGHVLHTCPICPKRGGSSPTAAQSRFQIDSTLVWNQQSLSLNTLVDSGASEKFLDATLGCYEKFKDWFEDNFLSAGVGMIGLCIIEVLGMCFSMTLFCHISRSGLGYK